jgi:hypothetical protein
MGMRLSEESDRISRWPGHAPRSRQMEKNSRRAETNRRPTREIRGDGNAEAVPYRCFCLGTGFLYTDLASGVSVRACGYLHAVIEIEKRVKSEE